MTEPSSVQSGEIVPGKFGLVFDDVVEEGDDPIRFEITFTWDGEDAVSFVYDAWHEPSEPSFVAESILTQSTVGHRG